MLEDIINLVRQHAGTALINNPAVPNGQLEAVISTAAQSIETSLRNMIADGKLDDLLRLFHNDVGNSASNPVVHNVSESLTQTLADKFGLNQTAANGIATNLIPNVLQSLVSKTNDPADGSFSLDGIIRHLTNGAGIGQLAGNLSENNVAEGLMQKIKGLFAGN